VAKEGFSGVNIGSRVPSILNHMKTGNMGHSKFTFDGSDYYSSCSIVPTPKDVKLLEELKLKKPFAGTHMQGTLLVL